MFCDYIGRVVRIEAGWLLGFSAYQPSQPRDVDPKVRSRGYLHIYIYILYKPL